MHIFFIILALTSDCEFSTLSKFIVLSVFGLAYSTYFLQFSLLNLTDARHDIYSPTILQFQSGSLLQYHMVSRFASENSRHSCIDLVSIFFGVMMIVCIICPLRWAAMDCRIIRLGDHLYFATQIQL